MTNSSRESGRTTQLEHTLPAAHVKELGQTRPLPAFKEGVLDGSGLGWGEVQGSTHAFMKLDEREFLK